MRPSGRTMRRAGMMNRLQAWRAGFSRVTTRFREFPEPRTTGSVASGLELMAGRFMLAGHYVNAPGTSPWKLPAAHPDFEAELHGFGWLDDLAALGDGPAQRAARAWTREWIARFGRGRGPGWTPELTGRRLMRWVNHALLLLEGADDAETGRFFQSLARQTLFLSRRWHAAPPGLPRFEALTGLIHAAVSATGMEHLAAPACGALGRECAARIDDDGGLATRNPEELLEVFTLLAWSASMLSEAGDVAAPEQVAAIERIAPTLRTLRHSDGGLARFHGGGRGAEGRLDHALAASGVRGRARTDRAMGFSRLSGGRTTVIVDAAAPPPGVASLDAHASTLAFELSSARRPVIVSCGDGRPFGPEWARAGRATPSHTTLAIEGVSSSRLGRGGLIGDAARVPLRDRPREVTFQRTSEGYATAVLLSHDGYVSTHGLTHVRRLDLSADGRALMGEDTLGAMTPSHRRRLAGVAGATRGQGVRYMLRFHLHPDVEAVADHDESAVRLTLLSGEVWVFRHDGSATLSLEPSVYLEKGRLRPRTTSQIVLTDAVLDHPGQVNWTLAKAADTPIAVRDVAREEAYPVA